MKEKKSCKYDKKTYPDGARFCLGDYCFKCANGELHPYSGVFPG